MWNNVALALLGIACLFGGILHIRNPERLADQRLFRQLSVAGLLLPRGALLNWVRFLGIVLIVIGICVTVYVAGRLHSGG